VTYSVVFSLPRALRTLFTAGLTGVQVLSGPRTTPAGSKELALQEFRATAGRPVTGGMRRETGSFVLRVYVEVKGAGEDAIDDARDAADAVLHAAADVLEANPTISGLALFCDVSEIAEDDQSLIKDGHTFTAHATVTFTADVNPGA